MRPFLLLATQHAVIRKQIAQKLGLSSIPGDAHHAAKKMLLQRFKGLRARAGGSPFLEHPHSRFPLLDIH